MKPKVTEDMMADMAAWFEDGECNGDIAETLGISKSTVHLYRLRMGYEPTAERGRPKTAKEPEGKTKSSKAKKKRGRPPKRKYKREKRAEPTVYYTIIRNKGEEVIAKGTAKECAKILKTSPEYIQKMAVKYRRKKLKHFTVKISFEE